MVETLVACYRIGSGLRPEIEKKLKNIGNGLPQKIGKNSRKIGNWPRNPVFEPFFEFFGNFSPFWGGGRFPYFPFFAYFGPEARNPFCGRPTGSQCYGLRGPSFFSDSKVGK